MYYAWLWVPVLTSSSVTQHLSSRQLAQVEVPASEQITTHKRVRDKQLTFLPANSEVTHCQHVDDTRPRSALGHQATLVPRTRAKLQVRILYYRLPPAQGTMQAYCAFSCHCHGRGVS